jgi:hypothetical protein
MTWRPAVTSTACGARACVGPPLSSPSPRPCLPPPLQLSIADQAVKAVSSNKAEAAPVIVAE